VDHSPPIKVTLRVDSVPAIHRIQREGLSGSQKAVDIRYHALTDSWSNGGMALEYIPDLLTKSLPHTQLMVKRSLCGLV